MIEVEIQKVQSAEAVYDRGVSAVRLVSSSSIVTIQTTTYGQALRIAKTFNDPAFSLTLVDADTDGGQ